LNQLASQTYRRFIKTHLPLDGLPYYEDAQCIVVSRDPRDVFVSLLNQGSNHTPQAYMIMNSIPGRVGEPFPPFEDDVPKLWKDRMTRGWFEWESDGYPYWSHLHYGSRRAMVDSSGGMHFRERQEGPRKGGR